MFKFGLICILLAVTRADLTSQNEISKSRDGGNSNIRENVSVDEGGNGGGVGTFSGGSAGGFAGGFAGGNAGSSGGGYGDFSGGPYGGTGGFAGNGGAGGFAGGPYGGAGGFAGNGAAGGFAGNVGSFASSPLPGFGFNYGGYPHQPFVPNFVPHINNAEYQRSLNEYLDDVNNYNTRAYTSTYASPNAQAYAASSMVPNDYDIQQQIAAQQSYLFQIQQQAQAQHAQFTAQLQAQIAQNLALSQQLSGANGVHTGSSASIGPNGGHQTAFVHPPNPASPNIDTRFEEEDGHTNSITSTVNGKPGFHGVSTSSFSSSSDINGDKKQSGHSVTTINDNGKVTTYETRL